jgi:hypothetical protein
MGCNALGLDCVDSSGMGCSTLGLGCVDFNCMGCNADLRSSNNTFGMEV